MNSKFDLIYEKVMSTLLKEGGHAFENFDVNVGPIAKEAIQPTLDNLNKILFEKLGISKDLWTAEIGSVGKKDKSGDIDIALDFPKIKEKLSIENDQDLRNLLMKTLTEANIINRQKLNNVHLAFPIANAEGDEHVQIDLFPSNDLEFTKKEKFSPYAKDTKYKGVHRRLAIASLVKAVTLAIADDAVDEEKNEYTSPEGRVYPGLRFKFITLNEDGFYQVTKAFTKKRDGSYTKDPKEDKAQRKLVTKDFQAILDLLFGEGKYKESDLYSFETIWNNILMDSDFPYANKLNDIVLALYKIFENSGNTIPEEVQQYLIDNNIPVD